MLLLLAHGLSELLPTDSVELLFATTGKRYAYSEIIQDCFFH